ncbi:hypothetical protein [Roseovarius sp. THAF8]|uniref:hypothetical protein n=1 Tax=Roseovarius sp. THAF8 TaxID=2587846 RepID=UPI0012689F03|nr:hypothetical protein [Roseovarius sp. THAF8]
MSRRAGSTARKEGPNRLSFDLCYDFNSVSYEDPRTQIQALFGPVIETSPFTACLHDQSVSRNSRYDMPKITDMKECASNLLKHQDREIYLSAGMFPQGGGENKRCRWKTNICAIPALMLDLDFHKTTKYGERTPEQMVHVIFRICRDFNLPSPDMIVFSGGGLQLYWIFEPMSFSKRFPKADDSRDQREINSDRWLTVVRQLWQVFAPLGADYDGNNVVRLTRLVGSKSARNGNIVRIVHLEPYLMDPGAGRGTFNELESAVQQGIEENFENIDHDGNDERKRGKRKKPSPVAKGEVADDPRAPQPVRESFQARNNVINLQSVREREEHCHKELLDYGYGTQARNRLTDIFKLIEGRHGGQIPRGFRNSYIYSIASLFAFLAPPAALEKRTHELAQDLCGDDWTPEETHNSISSVLKRAEEAANGKTRLLNGREVDPRYWYNSNNFAEFLNVSLEEMQAYDLRAIINGARRAENDKAKNTRKNAQRAQQETPEQRRKKLLIIEIQELSAGGMSIKQIVRETGKARNTVKSYINQEKPVLTDIHENPELELKVAPEQAQEKRQEFAQKPVRKIKSPMLAKTKKANREAALGHPAPANDSGPGVIEFRRAEPLDDPLVPDPAFGSPMEKMATTGCPF